MKVISEGPRVCKVMFVGEKPGYQEVQFGRPLVGPSGHEFDRMIGEAGINRTDCFITNVAHEFIYGEGFYKAPQAKELGKPRIQGRYPVDPIREGLEILPTLIEEINPNIVILLGEIALWAVTGETGIKKWRGSVMELPDGRKVLPTYNPAYVLKDWGVRSICVQDFRRAKKESAYPGVRRPSKSYIIRPSFEDAMDSLAAAKGKTVAVDIETRGGHTSCIGFGTKIHEGICIPLTCAERPEGYFPFEEEALLREKFKETFTDPGTELVLQNGLYDAQYIAKDMGFMIDMKHDTSVMQHVCFPSLEKRLNFIASMYCEHYEYWKDDGKDWESKEGGEENHWVYNLDDVSYTLECYHTLKKLIEHYGLEEPYTFQMSLWRPVTKMMLRGIQVDHAYKSSLEGKLLVEMSKRAEWFEQVLGHPFNPDSPKQMSTLFHRDFKLKPVVDRKTRNPTLANDALETHATRVPLLKPLVEAIQEYRSIRIYLNTYARAALSSDGRIRSSFNINGTNTFRFSSSKYHDGTGVNLQTISKGVEDEEKEKPPFEPEPGILSLEDDRYRIEYVEDEGGKTGKYVVVEKGVA